MKNNLSIIIIFLLVLASCQRSQLQRTSQLDYEKAWAEYAKYNYQRDTTLVDSMLMDSLHILVMGGMQQTREFDGTEVFKMGQIPETGEYIVDATGETGELNIFTFDRHLKMLKVAEANDRLPMEYHAYSRNGIFASEAWSHDEGEKPLDIVFRTRTADGWQVAGEYVDSTVCLMNAWSAKNETELRSIMFWGADNTLYLKGYPLRKSKTVDGAETSSAYYPDRSEVRYYKLPMDSVLVKK